MAENATSARILMKATGETSKVTGLTLSTASTLYILKYMTAGGCVLVEYLPHIFNPQTSITFKEHLAASTNGSWYALMISSIIMTCGVIIRKFGTILTDDVNINRVETFLYSNSNSNSNTYPINNNTKYETNK
jgi:hypothetical protein